MKLSPSTRRLERPLPVLALAAALLRLKVRREEQLRLKLQTFSRRNVPESAC